MRETSLFGRIFSNDTKFYDEIAQSNQHKVELVWHKCTKIYLKSKKAVQDKKVS